MAYKLIKFTKETALVAGADQPVYVAWIKKDGMDQPFRVSVEHFEDPESAKAEVMAWIKMQEDDEDRWNHEKKRLDKEIKNDETLDALNKELES